MLMIMALASLAVMGALADEAENLTEQLTIKCVDTSGRAKNITDGKYTTYWESTKRNNPYVVISSDKPIYGLYLCFRYKPDSYVIQKEAGDGWETVMEGTEPYHHAFYELDGLKKIRIYSTMEKKNSLAFNEIYAFGQGEVPSWVQRWEPTEEKADILFIATHPDDDLLFMGSPIAWYGVVKQNRVVVAYLTSSNTTRRSEALNGLWALGIRHYPVFGPFGDRYAKTGKLADAYKETTGGKKAVWEWMTGLYRQVQPEVVVTHAIDGEYGHPQHKMVSDSAINCLEKASDAEQYPESAAMYGTWTVKKLYIHLYGDENTQTDFDWNQPAEALGGLTPNEISEKAFEMHVTQANMGAKFNGKKVDFSVEEYGIKRYPNNRFGLYASQVGPDETGKDFLEHIDVTGAAEEPEAAGQEPAAEAENAEAEAVTPEAAETEHAAETIAEADPTETEDVPVPEEATESAPEQTGNGSASAEQPEEDTLSGMVFLDVTAPDWADVRLNGKGFINEGEYVFEDEEEGHWMYVSPTLRVVIERTYEVPDKKHPFYCFTANVWCDIDAGELPTAVFADPENKTRTHEHIKKIAADNHLVLATSTDYFTYRIKAKYPTGIEVRNGEVIFDDPHRLVDSMPTYETLALYRDGHAESLPNPERGAEEYISGGALQVYTFGPCLVKDGELTEYVKTKANTSYNPRMAAGVAENGHYVLVLCEGRIARSKGVQMPVLAQMMLDRGCRLAVNLDGGQTAIMAFMGKQLNQVQKTDPYGRSQAEVLAFGVSELAGK